MKMSMVGVVLAGCVLVGVETAAAQETGPHGGVMREAGVVKVELVFDREGVHLFVVGANDRPVDLKEAEGTIQLTFQDDDRQPEAVELKATRDRAPKHLAGRVDLAGVQEGRATAAVTLTKVPGTEGDVTVELPFRLARLFEHSCPMRCVPGQAQPGKCSKCKMDLVQSAFIFACTTHPRVTSREPRDKCTVCNAALERRNEPRPRAPAPAPAGHGGH